MTRAQRTKLNDERQIKNPEHVSQEDWTESEEESTCYLPQLKLCVYPDC